MQIHQAEVLFEPPTEALRFLPEGPYRCADGRISWVAIQHGADQVVGSLNRLDLRNGANEHFPLPGRPGFAFPTDRTDTFLIGLERSIILFDVVTGESRELASGIESGVDGTIINDGVVMDGHLVFGCKDLRFAEKKAGLYLLRRGESQPIQLRNDQICSNGKAVMAKGSGRYQLYDICSGARQVVVGDLDIDRGKLDNIRTVVDLSNEPVAPDGMIMTADQASLIVALYDPRDVETGEARQYRLATGELEAVWRCPQSPRVTCPQLIWREGQVQLLLTTADEGMSVELRRKCPRRGCMFVGRTDFTELNDAPVFPCPR